MTKVGLAPIWETFYNKVKYTYGESPFVNVEEFVILSDINYRIDIYVSNNLIAKALRQVIPTSKVFNEDIVVDIVVYDCKGNVVPISNEVYTTETLAQLFCRALYRNPLFIGTVITPEQVINTAADVNVVIRQAVVQFYNDDISELCGNYNGVAGNVFMEVTNYDYAGDLTAAFTTYDPKCAIQRDIYCSTRGCC